MTAGAIDLGLSPSVVTAMAKYHMTEMARQTMDDALDIHSGKGIQLGPKNYLGHGYMGIPISITVEGANILTRNLMIFGQGATRCHPYVFQEMEAAANPDVQAGLLAFDSLLAKHVAFATGNFCGALWQGLTRGAFNGSPVSGATAKYYKQLSRMSRALALSADFSMLILGGDLKRKEMISARLGDVLSHLYIASTVLKKYEDDGRQQADLPFVAYSVERSLHLIGKAFDGFFQNFPVRAVANLLKFTVFPFGIGYKMPKDDVAQEICVAMQQPGVLRDRLTHLAYIGADENDVTGHMEKAFIAMVESDAIFAKINKAQRAGQLPRKLGFEDAISQAQAAAIISDTEAAQLHEANRLRFAAISVDSFAKGELERQVQAPSAAA